MAKISGKETVPEILVRKFLFARGLRFRKNAKNLPGKPDIVLPRFKTVVFIHGCFWHGHRNCQKAELPATNTDFWKDKISKTMARDKVKESKLQATGWKVLTVWQCDLQPKKRENTLNKLEDQIKGQ